MNYVIQKGDTLYDLAKKNNVTVDSILKENPQLNPYNLIVGSFIQIPMSSNKINSNLKENMRQAWEQHVFWTRLLLVSISEHLADEPETTERLLRNANDLGDLYRPYYGNNVANIITNLIREHLIIGGDLIHAVVDNDILKINELNTKWYQNADMIADSLSSINPYYNKEELREMLYMHLDLIKDEVANRVNRNYKREIEVFDEVEKEAIMMADYLSQGINRQFS